MHSAAAHGFAAYDTMRRVEAYRHPLDAQDPLALQHPLALQSNNDHQVIPHISNRARYHIRNINQQPTNVKNWVYSSFSFLQCCEKNWCI